MLTGGFYSRRASRDYYGSSRLRTPDHDFEDLSIAAIAADVTVDHLALSSVVLNGWSLGGAV